MLNWRRRLNFAVGEREDAAAGVPAQRDYRIAVFNFYISVAEDLPFKRRFAEVAGLSLGVAGLSFLVGLALRLFLGVEV